MQPRQAFFRKYVPRRASRGGLIECADMKMHFRRAFTFAGQGGPAPRAESAPPAGRRIELRYLPFGYRISVTPECHEHGDRRTAMLATALAMAPCHPYRVSRGDKLHRAAQAPALELFGSCHYPPLRTLLDPRPISPPWPACSANRRRRSSCDSAAPASAAASRVQPSRTSAIAIIRRGDAAGRFRWGAIADS